MKKLLVLILLFALCILPVAAQAACTQAIPTQFKSMLYGGAFQNGHTYKVALYTTAAATLGATTTAYTATGELANGNGYTTGGATMTGFSVTVSGTTAILDWTTDPSWPASTITADCYLIYDDTLANSSCTGADNPWDCCTGASAGTCTDAAVYVGTVASTSSTNGTWTLVLPTPDAANGLLRIN